MPSISSVLLATVNLSVLVNGLTWTSCGTGIECATLQVPLEYGSTTSKTNASIALARYPATVAASKRLGSLLINPGGPGASGVGFVQSGAGAAVSALSGGLYDVIGWDPRGTGASSPILECFANAKAEFDFNSAFPSAPNLWLGQFSNSSANAAVTNAITSFDTSVASLANACVAQKSSALFTSTAAYVARDMAAIVDAVDGTSAKLNYWGFSYGTIFLAEFIQTFPGRVGRIIADGVFDAKANALTYVSQLPNDQLSVRASLNDFSAFCATAGSTGCSFAAAPSGVTGTVATRIDNIMQNLFNNPIVASGLSISLDILSPTLASLLRVPTTWKTLATVLSGLENRNATALVSLLGSLADSAPTNNSAPGVGTLATYPLGCVDNAASNGITLDTVISLTKNISITENTPILSAGLIPITFCRNFPATRPLVANLGVSAMAKTDTTLATAKTSILIISAENDPTTPLKSAKALRALLPSSSVLAYRGGSGHTTVSHASLGLAKVVSNFFVSGTTPSDGARFVVDQNVFPKAAASGLVTPAAFNGTYTTQEQSLLTATYNIGLAFLAIA
ncbi:1d70b8ab-36f8-458f-9fbf-3001bdd8cc38-CDS [Sclerotinia trifoliorum]|uniref:1d70b8ab-36f8-458f-9fbf-3001bdd8cc38-CDS n=1 Tax=Sclerotinia trifoliorum TaxID=28548 RepID=A0A8H2ZUS9_9HELO|nr:1d70b8ab-36f8-458f-9fbf-3001bdd8cc38-CDS [Sclerotinia trifoliorum]